MIPETWTDILKLLLVLLSGGGGYKVAVMVRDAWRGHKSKGERQQDKQDREDRAAIDITDQLRGLARDAVAEVRSEMELMRRDAAAARERESRLTTRVAQLERVLHDNGLEVPVEIP